MSYYGYTAISFGLSLGGYYYCEPPPPYLPPHLRPGYYESRCLPAHIRPRNLGSATMEPPRPPIIRPPQVRLSLKHSMPSHFRATKRAVRNLFRQH